MRHGSVHTGLCNCFHKDGENMDQHPKYEGFAFCFFLFFSFSFFLFPFFLFPFFFFLFFYFLFSFFSFSFLLKIMFM